MRILGDESLVQRLPLPLAKLLRRAQNAKTPLDRHQASYFLWEASLKLLGFVAVVEYAELGEHDPKLVEMLKNLARPAVGHWWEFVRRLVPPLADSGDEGFARVRELILGRTRDDLPRAAGLDAAIVGHLSRGKSNARATVQLTELFHRLVEYRNREASGHGALGMRGQGSFYDRMARALFGGMTEILEKLDVLVGRRLIYVGEVRRQSAGDWLVERFELIGESARRIESLTVPEGQEAGLPRPERVYIERAGDEPAGSSGGMHCLSPLIHFQPDAEQVFFLNARRGKRQAEYLCYHDGEQLRRDLATEQRELLATVLKMGVDAEDVAAWLARSQAADPAVEEAIALGTAERTIGEFELLSRLGRGGMGVVYRAWQPSLGRQVALKCMLKSGDPKAEARFAREIHALGKVEHPGVVKVFTSGSEADQWFFAMELVEGADLARVCEQLSGRKVTDVDDTTWREALTSACAAVLSSEVPLSDSGQANERLARARASMEGAGEDGGETVPSAVRGPGYVAEVVEIIRQVADAVDALHEAGIVHRDIKPGNVMVGRDGKTPVLMDLGLAQLADEAEGRLTRTRQFIGTLRYASPEQVLAATRVDRRSDVYGLRATLWELLTLRPLFGATDETPTPELMQTILVAEPGSPRKLNPAVARDLEAIVLKCLEKDKARRYATAGELAADLGRFLRNEPVTARLSSPLELTVKWMRRRPSIAALNAAVFVVGFIGSTGVVWQWRMAVANAKEAKEQENNAILARNEAETQRKEAKVQENKAILARDDAETQRKEAKEQKNNAIRWGIEVWKKLLKTSSPSDKDIEQADQIFVTLNATVEPEELALVLPEETRDLILDYYRQVGYYPRINWSPARVRNLQRALKIAELMKSDRLRRQRTLWRLADAYRLDGREPDAVETIQKLLRSEDLLIDDRIGMNRDYVSMMICAGTPGKALDEINKQLARLATNQKGAESAMLLIRSRLYAALKEWGMAEKDVTRFIETARKESISYSDFAEACLFRGFLLERGGHKDEAAKAWRAGLRTNWPKSLPFFAPSNRLLDGKALRDSSRALLHFTMLASLVGELGLEETDTIVSESMGYGDFKLGSLIKFFDLAKENSVLEPHHIRAIVLGQYNTPLGHEFARRAAYLEISLKEEFNRPLLLAVESEIRLSAIPEGAEPELARLIDEGLAEINQAHQESRFDDSQLMKMFRAWMGGTGIFGWSGLERSMNNMPELRGKIAYVYGRRFLVLKQPEFARRLFQLSTRDLPLSSPLHKLAQVQLDKLGAK